MLCPRVLLIDLYIFDPVFDPVFSLWKPKIRKAAYQPRPQGAFPWRPAPKAREKRPGDEVGCVLGALERTKSRVLLNSRVKELLDTQPTAFFSSE